MSYTIQNPAARLREGDVNGYSNRYIVQLALVVVFSSSFFMYFLDLTRVQLAVPIAFLCLVSLGLLSRAIIRSAISGQIDLPISTLLAVMLYAVGIPTVVSLFSNESGPALYAAALIVTLISVRIILGSVSIVDVMTAFFYSGLIATAGFAVAGYEAFSGAISGDQRLNLLSFHPNLIGFIFGGFASISVFVILQGRRWLVPLGYSLILISTGIIFFASSRGSIVSLSVAGASLLVLSLWRRLTWYKVLVIAGWFVVLLSIVAVLGALAWAVVPRSAEVVFDYVDKILQLTNENRGLDTGLTGRLYNWDVTVAAIDGWRWLVGYGFRTSEDELGIAVDNGYLTLIYDMGFVAAALVIGGYCRAAWHLVRIYMGNGPTEKDALALGGVAFLSFFLTNNIVARYLFGIGNPISLLALFFLLLHADEFRPRSEASGKVLTVFRKPSPPSKYSSAIKLPR